jgi:HEAT repeat protein
MFSVATVCVILGAPAAGQAQAPRPQSDAQTLSRGWAALATGRRDEAASLADGILKRKPQSHAALSLKLEALSTGSQPLRALDAYEQWLPKGGRNVDDRGLLEPIALGILRTITTDADAATSSKALQILASTGDSEAEQSLRKRSSEGDQTAALALATAGDPAGITGLQTLVAAGSGRDTSAAIAALAAHGGLTMAVLDTLIKDRVPMNRAAAARALGSMAGQDAEQRLAQLSQDPDPLVRMSVTLAQAKKGDEKALADARGMLASEVPDLRLIAAEALESTLPQEAEQATRPLLTNRDGLNRFRAAAIVGRADPAAVQSVLLEGLMDKNPLIQQESARIVAKTLPQNLVLLRQLLRHADRTIVVSAAGAIVRD